MTSPRSTGPDTLEAAPPRGVRPPRRRRLLRFRTPGLQGFRAPQLVTLVGTVLVWWAASATTGLRWLPSPAEVGVAWWDLVRAGDLAALSSTARTLAIGLAIVFVVGSLLAALLAASPLMEAATEPFVNAALATPTIALIPVFITLWGFKDTTRVATVISFSLFPVVVTWVEAVKNAPAPLLEMSRAFTAGPVRRLRSIVLPAAAPMLVTGVRIGVVQGIKGVVSAEVLVGVIGVGRLLQESAFDLPRLYAVVLTLIVISIVVYMALFAVDERMSRRTQNG